MKVIAYLLGVGSIAGFSCLILYTTATVEMLKGLFQKYPPKYIAAVPAVLGVLFLISGSAVAYPWVFRLIGLLAIGKGVLAYTNPQKIFSRMTQWYFEKVSEQGQRLFGIIGVILGTAILSWVQ